MKYFKPSVLLALGLSTTPALAQVNVTITFTSPTASSDFSDLTEEDKDAIASMAAEIAAETGVPTDNLVIALQPESSPGTASTPCREAGPPGQMTVQFPTEQNARINLNLANMATAFGHESYQDMLDEPGHATLDAFLTHEMGHVCIAAGGEHCFSPVDDPGGYACGEAAVDHHTHDEICEDLVELCMDLCTAFAAGDAQAISDISDEMQAKCNAAETLEDKYNNEVATEILCSLYTSGECDEFADALEDSPECMIELPVPPGFTPGDMDCDFPDDEVLEDCENCDDSLGSPVPTCDCGSPPLPPFPPQTTSLNEPFPDVGLGEGGSRTRQIFNEVLQVVYGYRHHFATKAGNAYVAYRDRDTNTGHWKVMEREFLLAYSPRRIIMRDTHDIFVLGVSARSNTWVVERIRPGVHEGAYVATRTPASQPVGEPYSSPATDLRIAGDVGYIPPTSRDTVNDRRAIVWASNSPEHAQMRPVGFTADPDGRFTLIADSASGSVLRISVVGPEECIAIHPTVIPEVGLISELSWYDSSTMGRVLLITYEFDASQEFVIATDADNDGDFESVSAIDANALASSQYMGTFQRDYQKE